MSDELVALLGDQPKAPKDEYTSLYDGDNDKLQALSLALASWSR